MAVENILPAADTATGTINQSVSQAVPAVVGALSSDEAARLSESTKNIDPESQVQAALPTWKADATGLNVSSDDKMPPDEVEGEEIPLGGNTTTSNNPDTAKSTVSAGIFKPIVNPLHQYATYTYNLSLHILPANVYKKMMDTGEYTADGNRVLIASAGRYNDQTFSRNEYWREDFYFETLKMTTVMGMNARTKGTNSIDMSFTIIEPYGISLVDRLMKTTINLNPPLPNYTAVPYLLQIDFFGSDDKEHNPSLIKAAQRRFPISLLGMTINFDHRGTVYNFTAVPYSHSALQELNLSLPATTTIRTDANRKIADFFSSTPDEIKDLVGKAKPAIEERKSDFLKRAIAKGKSNQQEYQKKLPAYQKAEAESRARDAAANKTKGNSTSSTPQMETKKSSIPPPPAEVTEATATAAWEKAALRTPMFPTSLSATGLASVLTAYNDFLKEEYDLVDAPVTYLFNFVGGIENATIDAEKLIPHELKPLANVPAQKNPEVINSNLRAAKTNLAQAEASHATEDQLIPLRAAVNRAQAAINPTAASAAVSLRAATTNLAQAEASRAPEAQLAPLRAAVAAATPSAASTTDANGCKPPASVSADTAKAANANTPVVGAASSQQYAGASGTDVTFNQGTSILTVINNLMKSSSYITEQLTTEIEEQLAANSDADMKKIKSEFEPYNHFKIIPSVEIGDYDPLRDDYAKTITFTIRPYQMHGIRYPGIKQGTKPVDTACVKEYNYLFTGKNTDIIDLKINFDNLYFTAVGVKVARLQKSEAAAPQQEGAVNPLDTDKDGAPKAKIKAKQSKAWPASLKFVPNTPGAMRLTQESIDAMRANDLFSNIYGRSSADMLEVNMDIVGDPGYLQQEEFTINPTRSDDERDPTDNRLNKDGSLIMTERNLLVKLNFKFPIDIDTNTGLYKFNDPSFRLADTNNTFTGIYRILTIENTFEHGVFKQRLNMVRVYNDLDSERISKQVNAKLNPASANSDQRPDTVDLTMGPQLPVDLTMGPQLPGASGTQLFDGPRLDVSRTVFATTAGRAGDINADLDNQLGNQVGAVTGMAKVGATGLSQAQQHQDRNAAINAANKLKSDETDRIKAAAQGRDPGPDAPNFIGA